MPLAEPDPAARALPVGAPAGYNTAMLNRCAIILRAKEPFREWLAGLPEAEDISLEEIDRHSDVYLLPECGDEEEAGHLVARGFKVMFEDQLELWCADERRYPEFTLATFKMWFDVEFRACVEDLGAEPLEDDRDKDRAISDHDGS